MKFIERIPLWVLVIVALALGLAPFSPEPHLWEKLKMLTSGTLSRPIDLVDLLVHGVPVVLLAVKLFSMAREK